MRGYRAILSKKKKKNNDVIQWTGQSHHKRILTLENGKPRNSLTYVISCPSVVVTKNRKSNLIDVT